MSPKRYIPILITIALLALIGLQVIWLFLVYKHKEQELKDKTREAVLETTKRLQQEEDSKLIINNIDSLLLTEDISGSDSASPIRVIVSNIRNKIKSDTLRGATVIEEINVSGDSSKTTTLVKAGKNSSKRIIVHATEKNPKLQTSIETFSMSLENHSKAIKEQSIELEKIAKDAQTIAKSAEIKAKRLEKKAEGLQSLFIKMALNAEDTKKNITERIDFEKLKSILQEELVKQGVFLAPEVGVSYIPKDNLPNSKDTYIIYNTPGFTFIKQAEILPLFPDDVFTRSVFVSAGFSSTASFVVKQMAGLLSLSLFITILIGVVMIYLFRRMLSQEKLHNMKNDFINNMTHELKTPIATISLAVDAINNPLVKNDEEKFRNYSGILKEENKKLNSHVERVLQMAILDKGETVLAKETLDLKKILENGVKAQQLQIKNKNAKIHFNSPDNLLITGDEFHLTNAFTNLLDNSLKYSKENPEVKISVVKQSNTIEIHFSDNGIGIDKSEQEKIFDKFYRVQGGNLHDVKGFGLGLSYVKTIIESHGGTIELRSEKDRGSEFIIRLKAYEV